MDEAFGTNESFNVGDKAVFPGHGVGEVTAIEERAIAGFRQTFYSLRILQNGMQILVPTNNVRSVGMREVIHKKRVADVLAILEDPTPSVCGATWNRRHREYVEKFKTGSLFEVAEVLRDLSLVRANKELSFGERKLLDTARAMVVKELAIATGKEDTEIETEIDVLLPKRPEMPEAMLEA